MPSNYYMPTHHQICTNLPKETLSQINHSNSICQQTYPIRSTQNCSIDLIQPIPICQSTHPLDLSISMNHIQAIQHQMTLSHLNPTLPLTTLPGHSIPSIDLE